MRSTIVDKDSLRAALVDYLDKTLPREESDPSHVAWRSVDGLFSAYIKPTKNNLSWEFAAYKRGTATGLLVGAHYIPPILPEDQQAQKLKELYDAVVLGTMFD